MFDVVIVDEASQAGLEATFLQYLAPKIVVIGDDKQVSPAAVGVDQQQLRDLANQYLARRPVQGLLAGPQAQPLRRGQDALRRPSSRSSSTAAACRRSSGSPTASPTSPTASA